MLPKWHILFGFIFSFVLIFFLGFSLFSGIIIFLSAIFIDLDHVLLYYINTKSLNPKGFFNYSIKRKEQWLEINSSERNFYKKPHFIFHGIEFVIIVFLLSLLHNFFLWIFLGITFHLFLDLCALVYEKEHLSIKTSQFWLWQRNKNKKKFNFK